MINNDIIINVVGIQLNAKCRVSKENYSCLCFSIDTKSLDNYTFAVQVVIQVLIHLRTWQLRNWI